MILAIDMGNTNTVIGGIDETKTYFIERVTTDQGRTDTEYAVSFKNILEMHQIDIASIEGAILSSVVPPVNSTILNAVEKVTGIRPLLVGSGMKTGMNIIMDNPKTLELVLEPEGGTVAQPFFIQLPGLYGCFLSGFAAWCSQRVKQFIFSHIICQQFPIVYLHKGCKHGLRGERRSHGGRRRIYADRTLIGFGIQFLLQSGIYHITAFRPPGRHFCLYLFLVTAQIETEHSRILSSRPVHKAVRQGITQGVLPALFHTDGYTYVLASLFLGLAGCQHPGRKEQEDKKKGPFSHISLA